MRYPGVALGLGTWSLAHAHNNLDVMFLLFVLSVPTHDPYLSTSTEKPSFLLFFLC